VSTIRSQLLWASEYPETALAVLYDSKFSDPYFYLHDRDYLALQTTYYGGYVGNHLVPLLPETYSNTKVTVLSTLDGVPPSSNSDLILVIPSDGSSGSHLFVTDILSFGHYNFTTMLESDPALLDGNVVVFPYDRTPQTLDKLLEYVSASDKKVLVFNTAGNGPLADVFFKGATTLSLNSDASLYLVGGEKHSSLDVNLIDTIEFTVENNATEHSLHIITEGDPSSFWTPTVSGVGEIGFPSLTTGVSSTVTDSDGLAITVGAGNHSVWILSHQYETSQDFSESDFLSFYWYGHANDEKYVLTILSPDSANRFRYEFTVDWFGWKKVILPLECPDGLNTVGGTTFKKERFGNPSWSNIRTISVGLSTSNPNVQGEFFLDEFGLDVGKWFNVEGEIFGDLSNSLYLSTFDGSNYVPLNVSLQESTFNSVYFMDGSNPQNLFATPNSSAIYLEKNETAYTFNISVVVPPTGLGLESSGLSALRFKLGTTPETLKSSAIMSASDTFSLPSEVDVLHLLPADQVEVIAWYQTNNWSSPYAVRQSVGEGEVIYVNIYPLIQEINSNEDSELATFFGHLLSILEVSLPEYTDQKQWINDAFISFIKAQLTGEITATSSSIVVPDQETAPSITITNDNKITTIDNISSLTIKGLDDVELHTSQLHIHEGKGYYSLLTAWQPIITINGESIQLSVLTKDGETINTTATSSVEFFVDEQFTFYFRRPKVTVDGEVMFEKTYASGGLLKWLRTSGSDLKIEGTVDFTLILSDVYTTATGLPIPYPWTHSKQIDPPLLRWDELANQITSLPVLATWIGIGSWFLISEKRKSSRKEA
jgi:hypothetical protein